MPLVQTRGAASAQGFGEFSQSGPVNYIEEVFSTWTYTGNSPTGQSINNGIDLSTKGGLVWCKGRTIAAGHSLYNTTSGITKYLSTNTAFAEQSNGAGQRLTSFNTNGFSLGTDPGSLINNSSYNYASWTFRKQEKFFDIVTYTGTGVARTVAHNLGSVPGCIIVKETGSANDWIVYHRSIGNTKYLTLNSTAASDISSTRWNDTTPTSTVFTVGTNNGVNANGASYIAYIFAHDAGGFGLSGSENVISCGSATWNGSGVSSVTLGYEPQWVIIKSSTGAYGWWMVDNMRGMPATNDGQQLNAEGDYAESSSSLVAKPTATGFTTSNGAASETYIYIAIRRGPMKVPTDATKVFSPATRTGTGAAVTVTGAASPPDFLFNIDRLGTGPAARYNYDRLRGSGQTDLRTNSTASEGSAGAVGVSSFNMNGFSIPSTGVSFLNSSSASYINYFFQRAPSFFDTVCDTGTGAAHTINHNLGIAPQLMIRKRRNSTSNWCVYPNDITQVLFLDATNPFGTNGATYWNSTAPTSTVFSIGTNTDVNTNGGTYVTYLFATCPGVSKVGSYTGTGTTQTINCGFTAGSRFVMIKRTDASGDWYVWDSARGIVPGNDPYLFFNDSAAEVTGTDYVDTANSGFELSSTAPAAINANGGTYIFLAIA